jgi:hypothetical protein
MPVACQNLEDLMFSAQLKHDLSSGNHSCFEIRKNRKNVSHWFFKSSKPNVNRLFRLARYRIRSWRKLENEVFKFCRKFTSEPANHLSSVKIIRNVFTPLSWISSSLKFSFHFCLSALFLSQNNKNNNSDDIFPKNICKSNQIFQ